MKKVLLAALFVAASLSASAQGTINFSNIGNPFTLDGNAIGSGAGLSAQLVVNGADVGDPANFLANGFFAGGARTVAGVAGGTAVDVSVNVLDGSGSVVGSSNTFSVTLGNAGVPPSTPAVLNGLNALALTSGGAAPVTPPVPEPSTIALAILGGAALLLRRRK